MVAAVRSQCSFMCKLLVANAALVRLFTCVGSVMFGAGYFRRECLITVWPWTNIRPDVEMYTFNVTIQLFCAFKRFTTSRAFVRSELGVAPGM